MASGSSTRATRQSEFGMDWRSAGQDRQPSLKPSIESDMSSLYESRASVDEPRKHISTTRRQSVRPAKQPQGARPLTRSPSKLPTSGTMRDTSRVVSGSSIKSSGVPRSRQSSYSINASFDPLSTVPTNNPVNNPVSNHASNPALRAADSQPFLPPVNFDDLHNSITMGENTTDRATSSKRSLISAPSLNSLKDEKSFVKSRQSMLPGAVEQQNVSRTGSLASRQGESKREGTSATQSAPQQTSQLMGPPVSTSSSSKPNRRQSHFPAPASANSLSKPPRKSVGPGILTQAASNYAFLQDEPQFDDRRQSTYRRRQSRHELAVSANGESRNGHSQTRSSKTRSTYAPASEDLLTTPIDADNPWSTNSRSPHRDLQAENLTPGSSRRMSMNPAAVGGLGARTISPTDVKRMKRLSMMQGDKHSPPISTQDALPPFPAQYNDSPSVSASRRKSATPSSNRNTPDPNRRSNRGSVSTVQNVIQGNWHGQTQSRRESMSATPKSPTLKARTETTEETPGEYVPPVPAIPKAYESPKNEQDLIFAAVAAGRKPSLVPTDTPSDESPPPGAFVSARSSKASYGENLRILDTPNSTHGFADEAVGSLKNGGDSSSNRKKRDPPRLPPLNLLPLSAPTAEKIAAIQHRASAANSGAATPPRKVTRTPTTPMTASKANFPSRYHQKEGTAPIAITARSNTSQYINTIDFPSYRPPSSGASSIKGGVEREKGRISPFVSSSAPKISGDFGAINGLRTKPSVDRSASTHSTDTKHSKLAGPRAQPSTSHLRRQSTVTSSATTATAATAGPASTDTDTTGSSSFSNIRRKLSLNKKRSTSKSDDQPPQPPVHTTMPPPKLPASATNGNVSKSGLTAARHKSSIPDGLGKQPQSASTTHMQNFAAQSSETLVPDVGRKSFEYRTLDPKITPNPVPHLSSRLSTVNGRSRHPEPIIDTKLDRDDQVAEQEMHKLANRRKKTEIEARELDALRKRAVPVERISPMTALKMAQLNMFERGEIVDYEDIFFTGTAKAEKLIGNLEAETANFGYDDDRGDYNIVLGDHLAYRYEVVDVLGKGSFGQVVRCVDHKTGGLVAIKIIRNKKRFHQQALVEVNILQKLKEWDPAGTHSMVSFTQSFYFRGHLCISTELLGMNLYEFIKIHDFRGFSLKLIRRFSKQMLNSMVLLKGKKVIHCDLKPENILLAHPAHSEIKVIDFGSSCMEHEKVYTYIQSRFYRSPEVILGMNYGMPIDMWSLGCILAELLTGYPLFPGENEQEQLACIMEVFGPPDKHLIEKSTRRKLFFDSLGKPRPVVSSKGKRRRPSSKTLQQALRCDDEAFLDFLAKCLRWDPEKRMKPDEAAQHEFITGVKQVPTKTIRSLTTPNLSSMSPMKRLNSTASAARPLPSVPDSFASGRPSLQGRPRDISPNKTAPKRHSTVTATTFSSSSKRVTANPVQQTNSSGLPRPGAGRTASGKQPDLASAAAAMATAVSAGNHRQQEYVYANR